MSSLDDLAFSMEPLTVRDLHELNVIALAGAMGAEVGYHSIGMIVTLLARRSNQDADYFWNLSPEQLVDAMRLFRESMEALVAIAQAEQLLRSLEGRRP